MRQRDITRALGVCASLGVLTAALALFGMLGPGCAPDDTPSRLHKTHLGKLPENYRPGSVAISTNGDAFAYVVTEAEGESVIGPFGQGPPFARCWRPTFAPASTRLYYWARLGTEETADDGGVEEAEESVALLADETPVATEETADDGGAEGAGESVMLLADETPVATGFGVPGTLVLSDDGSRWAALGLDAAVPEAPSLLFFLDGDRQEGWVDVSRPVFGAASGDGEERAERAVEMAMLAKRDDGVLRLVVDGADRLRFPPAEAPCAVAALPPAGEPDLWRHSLQRLDDGDLLVVTRDADGWGIYRDGERIASYTLSDDDPADRACLSDTVVLQRDYVRPVAQAPMVVWWEQRRTDDEARWRVVRNGEPLDEHWCDDLLRSQPPEIDPSGAHYAYGCFTRDSGGQASASVIKDGKVHGPYAEIWGLSLSEDGTTVVYGAVEEQYAGQGPPPTWSFYRNGQRLPGRFQGVWRPRLDGTGRHMAWQAKPDEDGGGVLGLDGDEITAFDEVLWGPTFEDDERVAWVIRRGRRLTRIDFAYGVE